MDGIRENGKKEEVEAEREEEEEEEGPECV